MTTLYGPPAANLHNDNYYQSESEAEEGYELADYDLDVVDDALLNPNNSEYMDHFGFKIQVKTDDESSSDDDSDFDSSDDECAPGKHAQQNLNSSCSNTTTTITSDDDSIDTNVTTPHHQQHQKWLSDDPKVNYHIEPLPKSDHTTTTTTTTATHLVNNVVPILKSPPSPRPDHKMRSIQADSDANSRSSKDTQRSSTSRHSILSAFNNAIKSARPTSVTSIQSPVVLSRPSQTFQQRQSKRYSEAHYQASMIGTPRSPASNHRHFDKLVSKFRRFSHNDHRYDSEKHSLLKEEALAELKIYREKGGFENKSINWGKTQIKLVSKSKNVTTSIVDFWEMVIHDFGRVLETQMDDLRQHLTKDGIPSPIRGLMWQIIAKSRDSFDMDTEYREILKRGTSPFEKQIQRDLSRTFPNHPYFMQEAGRQSLYNVAKAYSIFDQEVGYCQGLAFIIGCLLLHVWFDRFVLLSFI